MAEFTPPSFLQNQDIETIHERMLERLPDDIDTSVGGHPYNLTRPVAYEMAYLIEDIITGAIQLMFPKYCEEYDEILDDHAELRGLQRKEATKATCVITLQGAIGTVVPEGSIFSSEATNDTDSVDFQTLDELTLDGTLQQVEAEAVEEGLSGNVGANTLTVTSLEGLTRITNSAGVGGTDDESNESLLERIMEYDESQGASFVGNSADYQRWAESVDGVGDATVVPPDTAGDPIQIILTDGDGRAVDAEVITAVENYIQGTESDGSDRLMPINATISVLTVTQVNFYAKASIVLAPSYSTEDYDVIKADFVERLNEYLTEAPADGYIRYSKVASCLSSTEGVADFSSLQMRIESTSFGTSNISIDESDCIVATASKITWI